ncbi:hypothetical protein [Pseudoalteromonas sp. PA2MD11]|uniref:hypothetical protein n=1 Tax=Pseudoalteromonas sp. PA2MD11 TaxID=2785057 RepID=UPI001ADF2695|nr:hypothetical protein [Pseudoalteromonas sp. PA2MD11]
MQGSNVNVLSIGLISHFPHEQFNAYLHPKIMTTKHLDATKISKSSNIEKLMQKATFTVDISFQNA